MTVKEFQESVVQAGASASYGQPVKGFVVDGVGKFSGDLMQAGDLNPAKVMEYLSTARLPFQGYAPLP